jgi:beta-glucosidase
MMNFNRFAVTLGALLAAATAFGQSNDFTVSGKVVGADGQPISRATVTYTSIGKHLSWDFSKTDGTFGAHPVTVKGPKSQAVVAMPADGPVVIDVFEMSGRKVSTAVGNLDKGSYSLQPVLASLSKAMYLLKIRAGNAVTYQRLVNTGLKANSTAGVPFASANGALVLAKKMAAVDTVRIGKTGYAAANVAVTAYTDDIGTITLAAVNIDSLVNALLAKMSNDDKVRQMDMPITGSNPVSGATAQKTGLIFGGGGDFASYTPSTMADLCDAYANAGMAMANKIPIMVGYDGVHGATAFKGITVFPHNMGMGAIADTLLIQKAFRVAACEIRGTGATLTFAPCIAVIRDDRWGRAYEGFSESTDLTKVMARQAVLGFQTSDLSLNSSVAACVKHFAGDGGTINGQNEGTTSGTDQEARLIHLPAFREAVSVGVATVMPSFSSWVGGVSMHGNKALLTDWLKDSTNFDGFIVGDYQAQYRAGNTPIANNPSANSIIDGLDVPMAAEPTTTTIPLLNALIPTYQSRVDDAVKRILRIKYRMGLFTNYLTDRRLTNIVGSAEHRDVARACVRNSLVLLKNAGTVVPLAKTSRIALWGLGADNIGIQCGAWTPSDPAGAGTVWQGSMNAHWLTGTTIKQGFDTLSAGAGTVTYSANGDVSNLASIDCIIAVLSENPYAETWFNDIALVNDLSNDAPLNAVNHDLATSSNASVIANIATAHAAGKKVIVILMAGRPMDITSVIDNCDAFVWACLPGTECRGVAEVLYKDKGYSFTGKLPVTWPMNNAQEPINTGDGKTGRFAFGFGLTD